MSMTLRPNRVFVNGVSYERVGPEVRADFEVHNESGATMSYPADVRIHFTDQHPLYAQLLAATEAKDARYEAMADNENHNARIAKAEALIREAIHASAATDATATVYLYGLSYAEVVTALHHVASVHIGDIALSLPDEIIKAWGVADDGDRNEWNIEIVLRALA